MASDDEPPLDIPEDATWIGAGVAVDVQGLRLPGGLIYVGRHLRPVSSGRPVEPALINPELPIDRKSSDWRGEKMPYWPSYAEAAPECRTAYLQWLANGRSHPNVGIGYVFLFFFGLERRLLSSGSQSLIVPAERDAIAAEVERLLGIYGGQGSFRRYASQFVDVVRFASGSAQPSLEALTGERYGEYSLRLLVGLGRLVAQRQPLPADWALAWLRAHPETHLRTPAQRCKTEFEELFRTRYRRAYGDGMIVTPSQARLRVSYRPASASFQGPIEIPVGNLPEVTALSAPVAKLRELAESCVEDLEGYSRLLGRDPNAKGSLAAIALLPADVASTQGNAAVAALLRRIRDCLVDDERAVLAGDDLVAPWLSSANGKLAKGDAVALSQLLQKCGYGFEPDVRFGSPILQPGQKAVVFCEQKRIQAPSEGYLSATLLLHLAAVVAQADGSVDRSEEAHLSAHLEKALQLDEQERRRLSAYLQWLLINDIGLAGLKKRLSSLSAQARTSVAQFLASVAGADGRIDRQEIETLAKVYKLLGFEREQLYSDLHALGAEGEDAGPVKVQSGGGTAGFRIPQRKTEGNTLTLDLERVNAKIKESAAASALLREIFVDSEETVGPSAPPAASVSGLDGAHSAFVTTLSARPSWPRTELEAHAAKLNLMLDGALEVINERSFDLCGQPACEGDDPVEMNVEALRGMLA